MDVGRETRARSEIDALRVSSVLTVAFAVGAVIIALFSDSETMTLEAMSGVVDVVISVLCIFVIRKVHQPADRHYHFGYAKYEPLMTTVEGVLVTAVCASAVQAGAKLAKMPIVMLMAAPSSYQEAPGRACADRWSAATA